MHLQGDISKGAISSGVSKIIKIHLSASTFMRDYTAGQEFPALCHFFFFFPVELFNSL